MSQAAGMAPGVTSNRRILLAARPRGLPQPSDWKIEDVPVAPLDEGEVLVKVRLLSLDPAMRGWMNEGRSYVPPVGLGEVMRAAGVGEVVASRHPRFAVGTWVGGLLGVQQYCRVAVPPSGSEPSIGRPGVALMQLDLGLAAAQKWLNPLGMPGMTAYFGLLDIGKPQAGETVVVSGAAGAVGQCVGQIARIKGCRVVGIAGGKAKCDFVVNELGFDACIDYKSGKSGADSGNNPDIKSALKAACPDGIDVYFDNVGGEILDIALTRIAKHARIVICGAISQYNNTQPVRGPANYLSLLVNRARMEGMVVFDYADRYPQAIQEISGWMRSGRLHSREDVVRGLESFPDHLLMLFSGANFGKLVLEVA